MFEEMVTMALDSANVAKVGRWIYLAFANLKQNYVTNKQGGA